MYIEFRIRNTENIVLNFDGEEYTSYEKAGSYGERHIVGYSWILKNTHNELIESSPLEERIEKSVRSF